MDTPPSPEHEQLTEVKRLHFLVHPNFQMTNPERDPLDLTPEFQTELSELMDSYIVKAKELKNDEIMIALLNKTFKEMLSDFREGKEYTKTFRELKNILGKRMIALGDDHPYTDAQSYKTADAIAGKRGYHIPKTVYSEAYGEMIEGCVARAAQVGNSALELVNKTFLRQDVSDRPTIPREEAQAVEDLYDRVQFALQNEPS